MDSFSVNALCKHLDCLSLPSDYLATRWNKIVPRKVNIHVWRLIKDRLLTRFNLWFCDIDDVSLICPMCSNGLESIYHMMSEFIITIKVWKSIFKWLDLNLPFQLPPNEFLDFVNSQGNLHKAKDILSISFIRLGGSFGNFKMILYFDPQRRRMLVLWILLFISHIYGFRTGIRKQVCVGMTGLEIHFCLYNQYGGAYRVLVVCEFLMVAAVNCLSLSGVSSKSRLCGSSVNMYFLAGIFFLGACMGLHQNNREVKTGSTAFVGGDFSLVLVI
nr:RNA-directed DNA polymerase, eukaryota [Tanacetum cinerariifolium]